MIEINKRTYMNEKTLQKNNNFNRLKDRIASVYAALLGWARRCDTGAVRGKYYGKINTDNFN